MKLFITFLCISSLPALGACHVITPLGSGTHTGADWNNAFTGIPATLIRGDVYYLADGNYASYSFNTADSGTTTIEIRKATAADHCAATGWNTATMGSSQAVFNNHVGGLGEFQALTDYLIVNGNGTQTTPGCGGAPGTTITGRPPTPPDCGIRLDNSTCSGSAHSGSCTGVIGANGSNLTFEYIELVGLGDTTGIDQIEIDSVATSPTNQTFNHIYGHNSGCVYFQDGSSNHIVENSYFWGTEVNGSDGFCHGQYAFYDGPYSNGSEFNNVYRDITGTAIWTFALPSGTHTGWKFYNNVIIATTPNVSLGNLSDGVIACINSGVNCMGFTFMQNTIINISNPGINNENTGNYTVQNNLYYANSNPPSFNVGTGGSFTQNHNSCLNSGGSCPAGTANVTDNSATNPFVSYTTNNFNLASENNDWNNRVVLGAPYNVDPNGTTRTTDRGAYQFATITCTATVTSPTASSVQAGIVNWTRSVSGCPIGITTEWIVDDFRSIGVVTEPTGALTNFNTGSLLDGPFNAKVIIRDGSGAILATSSDVSFVIQNFGLGNGITVTSPASFQSTPTVSGSVTFSWTTALSPGTDLQNINFNIDGQSVGFLASTNPPTFTYDTTQLTNGIYVFSSRGECKTTSTTCGTNPPGINIGVGTLPRIFIAFTVDVENGTVTKGVQPSIENATMVVGGTQSLSALLAKTDGTTTSGTFTYSLNHACILAESSQTQLPYPCVSGNTFPATSAQGTPYISLSSLGPTSSPVIITAIAQGETYITITDTISGRTATVVVGVKPSKVVSHLGTCGSIYSSYVPSGGCPSVPRTSIFNIDPQDTGMQSAVVQSNLTAFENQWWLDPGNGGATPYPNFSAWLTAWNSQDLNPLTSQLAAMPGLCLVLRSEGLTQTQQTLVEAELGPSSQGGSNWTTNPLPYSLAHLKALNLICGNEERDEANAGFGNNPIYSMKFSDSSISKIVVKSGVAMVYPGTPGLYPASNIYGQPQSTIFIRNATTAGFNGSNTVVCQFRSNWDKWFFNTAYCNDPSTGTPVPDSFTFNTTVADGTYNSGTDASIEILGWATYVGYSSSGSQQLPNNIFSTVVGQMRTAGIPQVWPILGASNMEAAIFWQQNTMGDYHTNYAGDTQTGSQAFPWGPSYTATYRKHFNAKWGHFNFSGGTPYWQSNGTGFVTIPQNVPGIEAVGTSTFGMAMGGITKNIVGMSGSTLTTTSAHGIPAPTPGLLTNQIKATISGNSDSTMNKNWLVVPLANNTLQVFSASRGIPGCSNSGSGSIVIRGVTYNITSGSGTPFVLSTNAPSDLVPGELVTISGVGSPVCNGTFAFFSNSTLITGVSLFNQVGVSVLANSTGTGGSIIVNYDQGSFNPLYDYNESSGARLGNFSPEVLYTFGEGYAGLRLYQSSTVNTILNQFHTQFPNDGQFIQVNPEPYTNTQLELQKGWWDGAPGLALVKRLAPFYLQTIGVTPWIAPGPPYVAATLETSSGFGNVLNVWNLSEVVQTVSVPLGTYCQVGTNPISVYEMDFPHSTTALLTGAQTNYSLTANPGQMTTFACHNTSTSFVVPTALSVSPPGGTATIAIQVVYGNYSQPLSFYTRQAVTGATSPVTVNIDTGWSSIWYQPTYLDGSGNVISVGPLVNIPASTPPTTLPVITTTSPLPNATLNVAYTTTLSASNGPITWAISSGVLPTGLSLASGTGVISGTPTGAGTTFGVTATNASGSASATFTLNVLSVPTITSVSPLSSGQINVAYSNQLIASGTSPITWAVTSGTLPNGLSLSSGGLISGLPGVVGTSTFGVTATNSVGSTPKTFSLTINPAPPTPPTITTTSPLPGGTQNVAYSTTIAVTGTAPITCAITGGSLPTGLSLGSNSCIISGVPAGSGASSFTITATNGAGSNPKTFSLTITATTVPPTITSLAPLPPGVINTPYTTTITATGTAPITWALVAGALPVGFSLDTATGIISGTTSTANTYNFTLSATNVAGSTSQAFILPISASAGVTIQGIVTISGATTIH